MKDMATSGALKLIGIWLGYRFCWYFELDQLVNIGGAVTNLKFVGEHIVLFVTNYMQDDEPEPEETASPEAATPEYAASPSTNVTQCFSPEPEVPQTLRRRPLNKRVSALRGEHQPTFALEDSEFRTRSPEDWTVFDVCAWLKKEGFGKYSHHFDREQINGHLLLTQIDNILLEEEFKMARLYAFRLLQKISVLAPGYGRQRPNLSVPRMSSAGSLEVPLMSPAISTPAISSEMMISKVPSSYTLHPLYNRKKSLRTPKSLKRVSSEDESSNASYLVAPVTPVVS